MKAASRPHEGTRNTKLLVVDVLGISHHRKSELPTLLQPGDLVVANDAATLPASLSGLHAPTGAEIEVRLAGRASLAPDAVTRFVAVLFGAGDYHLATEQRPLPPRVFAGDQLLLGPLRPRVRRQLGHPRLIELQFDESPDDMWAGLARHGRPIQYSYVPEPLALWDTWTSLAGSPVAFEAPSAGFILDWSTIAAIRARGARLATITHAAGISSTGDPELDRLLPLDEPYNIPETTAALLASTRAAGGRIIAIGTTVVRALEDAADKSGRVRPGEGVARRRIDAGSRLQVVDAIVSGMHEPGTSHYRLLAAFVDERSLTQMVSEAETHGYLAHEFGDSVLVERQRGRRSER